MQESGQKSSPNWEYEDKFTGLVAGIDEAGRGPLAGPVVTAAVILDRNRLPIGLNDSKKLSPLRREALYMEIMDSAIVGIGMAEPEEIDRINVLAATMVAMQRAVQDLHIQPAAILIDGNRVPAFYIPTRAIVKGDTKSLSIAAASIIAKVTRDRIMVEADQRFPGYGFSGHKGYPTKAHREALLKIGPCPLHRRTYTPVKVVLTSPNK